MWKREYQTEEEYRAAVYRRDEAFKITASQLVQLGSALIAAAAAGWWFDTVKAGALITWIVGAVVLLVIGFGFLRFLQAEG